MAKTIKFNLILDNQSVRTIEDLKENFSIEDVLEAYNNGLLQRWLEVRGYSEFLEKVNDITSDSNIEVIKKLIKIFEVEIDNKKIEESIAIFQYNKEHEMKLKKYEKLNFKKQSVMDEYYSGYQSLIDYIVNNKNDIAKIKASILEIEKNYFDLFKQCYFNTFQILKKEAPISIFAFLMNKRLGDLLLCKWNESREKEYKYSDMGNGYNVGISDWIEEKVDKEKDSIEKWMDGLKEFMNILGDELKEFSCDEKNEGGAYWEYVVDNPDKKILVLGLDKESFIQNANEEDRTKKLDYKEVNREFLILNGLYYMSSNPNNKVFYMEV